MHEKIDEVLKAVRLSKLPPGEVLPGGATADQLQRLEQKLGFRLPSEFASWLAACNGPCVGSGGVAGFETRRKSQDIELILANYPLWKERRWLPVAGDGSGNYYLLINEGAGRPVAFFDTMEDDQAPAFVVASNLWSFLLFFIEKELGRSGWPFDREKVLGSDPDILNYEGLRLPWNA